MPQSNFMQFSGNIWSNNRLAPRLWVGAAVWEIRDPPLNTMAIFTELIVKEGGQHSIPKPWNFSGYALKRMHSGYIYILKRMHSSMHWAEGVYPSMHWAGVVCVSQHALGGEG